MRTQWAMQAPDRLPEYIAPRPRLAPAALASAALAPAALAPAASAPAALAPPTLARPPSRESAQRVLAALPVPVALLDRRARLQYWNGRAASLLRMPALPSTGQPGLRSMLGRIGRLTDGQRDRIAAFAEGAIAGEDSFAQSCLCLSLGLSPGRPRRVALRIRGVEPGLWMMQADSWEPFRHRPGAAVRQGQ